jgi:hypothetical protein
MRFFRQDSLDEAPIPEDTVGDSGESCGTCGWAPEVTEIIEVVVDSHDAIRRLAEIEAMW